MADEIRATPRSPILGLFSDIVNLPLQYMSAPQRTQQSQGVAQFLYGTGIPKTLERASYGESLFSGAGGLGGTTRMRPETAEAVLNVAPFAPVAGRVANQAAMTAGRAGARYAERVVPQVMERGGLPAQLLGDVSRGSISPLDVYHGTPHTLPPTPRNPLGEFDASKIGTGEGAQAYGYGIYTAEVPTIAKEYRRKLGGIDIKLGDTSLDEIIAKGGADAKAAQRLKSDFTNPSIAQNPDDVSNPSFWKETENFYQTIDSPENSGVKKLLDKFGAISASTKGNLYKIDLPDEKIATMLDWDKPLSQQSPQVQAALKGIENDLPSIPDFDLKKWMDADPLASTWHNVLARDLKVEPSKIAELLQNKGVAGIRYLDEGSRATTGKQTSNFVVFPNEEKSMTILERNGMPATPIASPTYSDPFGNTIGSSIR